MPGLMQEMKLCMFSHGPSQMLLVNRELTHVSCLKIENESFQNVVWSSRLTFYQEWNLKVMTVIILS